MKGWISVLLGTIIQLSFGQSVEIAFHLAEKDLIPEGITYYPSTKSFYIGSINKRKIVKINEKGEVSDFIPSGHGGIGEVLGLKVANGKLWGCNNLSSDTMSRAMIHQFDLASGKLIRKWILQVPGENHLFNDLAISLVGEAFISDSDYGAVYRVSQDIRKPELWIKDDRLKSINGIAILPDGHIVVNASHGFYKIDVLTKQIKTLPFAGYFPLGIDGLSTYQQSLIGIQNVVFPGISKSILLD